ncbi:MAG: hypothetical protein PVG93_06800 [Phycisphaerales bacterium]|jgi:hypothetical protein
MRSIWAVAVNTIRQALRMKIALAFILLLVVLLPVMALNITGDGTIKGRLQTFVTYSLSLTTLILSLMTIILSTFSLADDIKQKRIYTVLTKPIRRFELLLGKLFGVILLNTIMLAICAGIVYAATIYMPAYYDTPQEELTTLNNEFYTARASLKPPIPDVTGEVLELYRQLSKSGQLPEGMSTRAILNDLKSQKILEKRAAAVGDDIVWEFTNVKVHDPNIFIRFKYDVAVNPPDASIYSLWSIGDHRQMDFTLKSSTPIYGAERRDVIRTPREFSVPADAVAADGYLAVAFLNVRLNPTTVIFPPEDGIELLYKAGTYRTNFLKAVLLILFRLIFLACLGVLASSFLSFPVAILLCLAVFFISVTRGFIMESFDVLSYDISHIYDYTIKMLISLFPQFGRFNAPNFLVPARFISWPLVAKAAALMVVLKSGLLLILAIIIFSFREIAKIIV